MPKKVVCVNIYVTDVNPKDWHSSYVSEGEFGDAQKQLSWSVGIEIKYPEKDFHKTNLM